MDNTSEQSGRGGSGMIQGLDHVNIRTTQLDAMIAWYGDILGMHTGWRPAFDFGGAWLYAGDQAAVHLVATDKPTEAPGPNVQLEHGAFAGRGFEAFIEKLTARGERYKLTRLDDAKIMQVNIWDPDQNHLHIDFPLDEVPD